MNISSKRNFLCSLFLIVLITHISVWTYRRSEALLTLSCTDTWSSNCRFRRFMKSMSVIHGPWSPLVYFVLFYIFMRASLSTGRTSPHLVRRYWWRLSWPSVTMCGGISQKITQPPVPCHGRLIHTCWSDRSSGVDMYVMRSSCCGIGGRATLCRLFATRILTLDRLRIGHFS